MVFFKGFVVVLCVFLNFFCFLKVCGRRGNIFWVVLVLVCL